MLTHLCFEESGPSIAQKNKNSTTYLLQPSTYLTNLLIYRQLSKFLKPTNEKFDFKKFSDSRFCDEFWERKDKEFLQNHKSLQLILQFCGAFLTPMFCGEFLGMKEFIATQGWVYFRLRNLRKTFIFDANNFKFAKNSFLPLKSCRFWTFGSL